MVKKLQKKSASTAGSAKSVVKDSAKHIWEAGLGALTRAQAEGTKAMETLVKESMSIQRKTAAAAEEKISEATNKMSTLATGISSKANGQWDKLETIFEERVAKALNKLGVPSAKDVNALIARIDDLNKAVQKLSVKVPAPVAAAQSPRKPAAKAATAKALRKAPTPKTPKVASKAKPNAKAVAQS